MHAVDSKPIAFELCAKEGFRAAAPKTKPVILEPIMKLEVVTPDDYVGSVIGDLNRRRGMPKGQEPRAGGAITIQAEVPLAEMFGYVTQLRTITSGRMNQKIRIKLRSYDHNLVDKSTEKIVKTVRSSGAVVTGPIPLPTEKKIFTVLRSPHVNKKSREQFQLRTHKRLIEIYTPTQKTVDALSKLELPSGVDIQVKLT